MSLLTSYAEYPHEMFSMYRRETDKYRQSWNIQNAQIKFLLWTNLRWSQPSIFSLSPSPFPSLMLFKGSVKFMLWSNLSSLCLSMERLAGISLPSDPVPGEPLLCGAADSDGPSLALHPRRQTAHQASWRHQPSHPAFSRGMQATRQPQEFLILSPSILTYITSVCSATVILELFHVSSPREPRCII